MNIISKTVCIDINKKPVISNIIIRYEEKGSEEKHLIYSLSEIEKWKNKLKITSDSYNKIGKEILKYLNDIKQPKDRNKLFIGIYIENQGTFYVKK